MTAGKQRKELRRILNRWQLYLMLSIPTAFVVVFSYIPMSGIIIAFKSYNLRDGIWDSPWAGLTQFLNFFSSVNFIKILKNTLTVSLYSLTVGFVFPVLFALLLNAFPGRRYKKMIQTVTYIPHFISTVIIVSIIFQLVDSRMGMYGNLYRLITDRQAPNLLSRGQNFYHLYVWSGVWQNCGYNSIMYFAALSGVDLSLHEAATIDGASRWQRVKYIDFPTILPTVCIMFILQIGKLMNVGYAKTLLMQNDLNISYSEVISTYVYKIGIAAGVPNYSYSTAIGLFNSVVNLLLLYIANQITNKINGYGIF